MKRLLSIGLLALSAMALADQQAQAWVNSRFSIGLNWHHQSGNTSYLWGLWRNGQVPGPESFGGGPGFGGPGYGGAPYMPPQSHPFPFFGQNTPAPGGQQQQNLYQPAAGQPGAPVMPLPNLNVDPANVQKVAQHQGYFPYVNPYTANPYQTVSYQQQNPYYLPSWSYHPYYQPTQQQGYPQDVPFYWYYNR